MNIHTRLYQEHSVKKQVKDWNQEFKQIKEVQNCTFKPELVAQQKEGKALSPKSRQTFKRLYTHDVQQRSIQTLKRQHLYEQDQVTECTFRPQPVSKQLPASADKENHFERLYQDYKSRAKDLGKSEKKPPQQSAQSSRKSVEESAQRLHSQHQVY